MPKVLEVEGREPAQCPTANRPGGLEQAIKTPAGAGLFCDLYVKRGCWPILLKTCMIFNQNKAKIGVILFHFSLPSKDIPKTHREKLQ